LVEVVRGGFIHGVLLPVNPPSGGLLQVVITTAPLSKTKPSAQMAFVLESMEAEAKKGADCFEKILESIDLLFSKMESQDATHARMFA
jgi:hypothetical protein